MAGALCLSASAAVCANAAVSDSPDIPAAAEISSSEGNTYYIFYKDIDTKEIDEIAAQKRHEYIYSLYEGGADEYEVELKSSDYYQEVRLGLVKAAYAEASARILEELGADSSAAFCSSYTPLIVCSLTEEQLTAARASENISEITAFRDFDLQPNEDTEGQLPPESGSDIVADAQKAMELLNACFKENNIDAKCVTSEEYPSYYPPLVIEYISETATGKQIMGFVEENNIDKSLFEVVPIINGQKVYWVYDTVNTGNIKGDANCDGKVDLADAILIMQALANPNKYCLTDQGRANADMNGDGLTVDDAQAIQRVLLGLDADDTDVYDFLLGYNDISSGKPMPSATVLIKSCSFCEAGETLMVDAAMGDISLNPLRYDTAGDYEFDVYSSDGGYDHKIENDDLIINGKHGEYQKEYSKDDTALFDIGNEFENYASYHHELTEIDFSGCKAGSTGCITFAFYSKYDGGASTDGTKRFMYYYVGEKGVAVSDSEENAEKEYKAHAGISPVMPKVRLYTSYSAEVTEYTELQPDKDVRISTEYDQASSSATGIGLLLEFCSMDTPITLSADKGEFRTWDTEKRNGPVEAVGQTFDIGCSGYVFWTPEQTADTEDESVILITGPENDLLGRIVLTPKDRYTYSAVLKNN